MLHRPRQMLGDHTFGEAEARGNLGMAASFDPVQIKGQPARFRQFGQRPIDRLQPLPLLIPAFRTGQVVGYVPPGFLVDLVWQPVMTSALKVDDQIGDGPKHVSAQILDRFGALLPVDAQKSIVQGIQGLILATRFSDDETAQFAAVFLDKVGDKL